MTLALLPPSPNQYSPKMFEIIVSPIAFDSWQYLTEITAMFNDTPGIVRKLARVADARAIYQHLSDPANDARLLTRLANKLKAVCLDDLALDGKRPRLKVRRMEGLRTAWELFRSSGSTPPPRSTIKKGQRGTVLEIPNQLLEACSQGDNPRAILVSDTKDRLLRILLPHQRDFFTYIRIAHNDQIGAVAAITDRLALAFNAVLTLLRLKTQSKSNDVELLLFSSQFPTQEDENKRREIAETLLASPLLSELNIEVSYPDRAGQRGPNPHAPVPTQIGEIKPPAGLAPLEDPLFKLSTTAIVEKRIEKYRTQLRSQVSFPEDEKIRSKLDAARYLLSEEYAELPSPSIFVSFGFDDQMPFYKDIVAPALSELNCEAKSGYELNGRLIRDEIIKVLKECVGFIGIWKQAARKKGSKAILSDWLLWEIGAAEAVGLPYRIFAHANVDQDHLERVMGNKHCIRFEDYNFVKRLAEALPEFLKEVRDYDNKMANLRYLDGTRELD